MSSSSTNPPVIETTLTLTPTPTLALTILVATTNIIRTEEEEESKDNKLVETIFRDSFRVSIPNPYYGD